MNISTQFHCDDFTEVQLENEKYDLAIGNPPYVNYKNLDKECISRCRNYLEEQGFEGKDFKNLWTFFVLKSINSLHESGSLHFILPKELMYVNHAGWLRSFLIDVFDRINLSIFDHFQFGGIEQDVIVIEGYKKSNHPGFFVCENLTNLDVEPEFVQRSIDQGLSNKWSQINIDKKSLDFVHDVSKKFQLVSNYCTSTAGIVTAANSFFIMNKEQIESFDGEKVGRPILQRSTYIQKKIVLHQEDFSEIEDTGVPCHLLCNFNMENPSSSVLAYLKVGEKMGLHQRYKMKRRSPWYKIPVVWESPAFFFKRIHEVPKLILNEANVLVTDTAYRVIPLDGVNLKSLIYSFYNSLTLVFCELRGRSYGGGVLELTPNEFKGLPVPYQTVNDDEFLDFSEKFTSLDFETLIAYQDSKILTRIGLGEKEILNIQKIRKHLIRKRLKGGI